MSGPKLVVIVGPTASGKTALSLRLAEAAGAEIVSADSQQVYRGMDIGTGKATPEERARVRHHLIDVVTPAEAMTAARFVELADAAIAEVHARGRSVVVAGGTGLYVRALLHGLFEGPPADCDVRAALEAEAAEAGVEALWARLRAVDPEAAARILPRDLRRIVRALEVHTLTGTPISAHQAAHDYRKLPERYATRRVGLAPPRAELVLRIDRRVAEMVAGGLVEEVRALAAAGHDLGARAFDAIGYREVRELLAGELAEAELVPAIQAATRRYARRQLSWFRAERGVLWYENGSDVDVGELAVWLRAWEAS